MATKPDAGEKLIASNKKAFHDYFILQKAEAGVALTGTEVKSLRDGKANIKDSYVNVSWDTVIDRDPEWIVVSNPRIPHDEIVKYLTTSPALKNVSAVKNRHILFMTYAERSPSPRNVDALERLARTIHPELFGQ